MSLSLMKQRIIQSGNNLREETINDARYIYAVDFKNDPSYSPAMLCLNYDKRSALGKQANFRIYNRKYSSSSGITQQFQSLIEQSVTSGDYFFDESDNTYWLCTESFNVDDIHYKGKLTQCNYNLYWQDESGNIVERRCFVSNSSSQNGESGNNTITLASNQFMVYMVIDKETIKLRNGKRVIIDNYLDEPYVYDLTKPNNVNSKFGDKGITYYIFTQTEIDKERDKLVVLENGDKAWLADYHSPTTPPDPTPPDETANLFANINGNTNLKVGFSRSYSVNFTDKGGVAVKDADFEWFVDSYFADKISKTISGNTIKLMVDDDSLIGKSFLLSVIVNDKQLGKIEITIVEGF